MSSPTYARNAALSPKREAETAAFAQLPTAGTTVADSNGILSPQRMHISHSSSFMLQCTRASLSLMNASMTTSPTARISKGFAMENFAKQCSAGYAIFLLKNHENLAPVALRSPSEHYFASLYSILDL